VTVAELTPYSIETAHGEGQYFPGRGFAYVVADVRGRGDSEGQFLPWLCDAQDDDDLIEWITQQPWSDGRVVLYGGSYSNGHLEKGGRCAYRCGSIASRGRVVSRDRDR
jgi:putative CocE/NonD family hydrolase